MTKKDHYPYAIPHDMGKALEEANGMRKNGTLFPQLQWHRPDLGENEYLRAEIVAGGDLVVAYAASTSTWAQDRMNIAVERFSALPCEPGRIQIYKLKSAELVADDVKIEDLDSALDLAIAGEPLYQDAPVPEGM